MVRSCYIVTVQDVSDNCCQQFHYLFGVLYTEFLRMTREMKNQETRDRLLGDEWEDWSGELDESQTYNETARLFTLFAGAAILVILAGIIFVLYMIEPRLYLLNPVWVVIARITAIAVTLALIILSVLIAFSVFTGKNLLFHNHLGQLAASHILPFALALARRMGIPRDRLGNSFVAFSNAMVRAYQKPIKGKTIVLIPRCLNAETRKAVRDICDRAGVGVFSATGGGQARKILREERPAAVIAVACERDLVSGIKDVAHKIPTLGVPNKRPEGPCKNTFIELDELREAIRALTGVAVD